MQKILKPLALAIVLACAAGCAVTQVPLAASLNPPVASAPQALTMDRTYTVGTNSLYKSTIRVGTRWVQIGSFAEGEVFKPVGSSFTVEGSHVHEAYLVLKGDLLTGFYLPVERTFSPLSPDSQIQLAFKTN